MTTRPTPEDIFERLVLQGACLQPHRDLVLEILDDLMTCAVKGHGALTSFCPRCRRSAKGSKVRKRQDRRGAKLSRRG